MEVMRIKAVSLAVVKIESGDWSEEELEEEEEKGEEKGVFTVFRLSNLPLTCYGFRRCC